MFEKIRQALVDVVDGCDSYDIQYKTGLPIERCQHIVAIAGLAARGSNCWAQRKLESKTGLACNLVYSDSDNATVIRTILEAYLDGWQLECAHRASGEWVPVTDVPVDFASLIYRKAQ